MKRLAVVCTHPIQYYAPVFRMLSERGNVNLKVFYTKPVEQTTFDKGFGQIVQWDIPLLEGYSFVFQPAGSKQKTRELINAIQNWEPNAILVYGWNPPGHLKILRHFKGRIPVWFRGDSTLLNEKPGPYQIARRIFLSWVYSHIDIAFYVGGNNKQYYQKHGIGETQLVFAPHAIDNERFSDGPVKQIENRAKAWRRELGIADNDFCILFAGKLEAIKSPGILLEAVQKLNQEIQHEKPVKLILTGSGPLESELKNRSQNDSNIKFLGFQNQSAMPTVYRLGDVFCLPSKSETWGLAVNEAMACGRPAIVSDKVGCAADLIREDITGWIFREGNLAKLIDCVKKAQCKIKLATQEQIGIFIKQWSFLKQVEAYEENL